MKIAVVGGTGQTGAPIVAEAAARGHAVTAISRHPEKTVSGPMVTAVSCDVFDTEGLAGLLKGHDWVVHAYSPRADYQTNRGEPHRLATVSIIDAVKAAGVKRLFAVGGAGTLEVAPGRRLMDEPDFPPEFAEGAASTAQIKSMLEPESAFQWTYLSPAAFLDIEGARTGTYRVGKDQLLVAANGRSTISAADLAVAVVDEMETPRHLGHRFTVGD